MEAVLHCTAESSIVVVHELQFRVLEGEEENPYLKQWLIRDLLQDQLSRNFQKVHLKDLVDFYRKFHFNFGLQNLISAYEKTFPSMYRFRSEHAISLNCNITVFLKQCSMTIKELMEIWKKFPTL